MSTVQINPTQKSRLYKIDVYGLQDNYLGTLQSYGDSFIGQIIDPELSISDDGTQSFSCSIPKFYIDPATNLRVINPRWGDIDKGVLAENTRILKVFIQFDNETKVFPFIIDSITDKRDNNFSVYRQITANGLAFAELGKVGYKIELSEAIVDQDREKLGYEPILNIDYWLDKIFPNERNEETGEITKWLTAWSYEIRTDWRDYPGEGRASNKIYDDAVADSWGLSKDEQDIIPLTYSESKERERLVEAVNSNKYNITQSIAEAFEVFCVYEYKCDTRGRFIKNYTETYTTTDEEGNEYTYNKLWTGHKVIFYNRAIKSDNPLEITYQKNLNSISRTSDTTDLYTKLYVPAIDDAVMDSGQISIADTSMNPLLDDFILNFDYLHDIGSITETQWNTIKKYKVELRKCNSSLRELQVSASKLQIEINKLDAKIKVVTDEQNSALERVTDAEQTLQALPQSESIERTLDRPVPVTFFEDPENPKLCKGKFNLPGIDITSVQGYQLVSGGNKPDSVESVTDSQKKEYWLRIGKLIQTTSIPNEPSGVYGVMDDMGYLSYMITNRSYFEKQPETPEAPTGGSDNGLQPGDDYEEANPNETSEKNELEHTLVYFTLTYNEHSYYEDIIETFSAIHENKRKELEILLNKKEEIDERLNGAEGYNNKILQLLIDKNILNQEFERKIGSALREGYWTPENTGGVYENKDEEIKVIFTEPDEDTEEVGYRYDSIENRAKDLRTYCPFIELPEVLWDNIIIDDNGTIITNYLKDLTLILKESSKSRDFKFQTASTPTPADEDNEEDEEEYITNALIAGYYSFKPYATSQLIYFKLEKDIDISGKLFSSDKNEISIWFQPEQGDIIYFINKGTTCPSDENGNPVQILKDLSNYLPQLPIPLILKNNSGYVFAYKKEKGQGESTEYKYTPILILNNDKLDYSQYDYVGYGYSSDNDKFKYDLSFEISTSKTETEEDGRMIEIVYPRIVLNTPNINSDSTSTFKIYSQDSADTFIELTRYDEYNVVKDADAGEVKVSLKISENNTFAAFNKKYNVQYQVSHANEHLYKDAYEVALENSKPRFSYEVSISNLPRNSQVVELGQLARINDYLLGAHRMRGYVSSISYNLNEPQSDSLTLQNYKTKFEDLFSTITASSEAMKTNQRSYDAAASSFDNRGNINGDILQSSINANEIAFNFSNTSVKIDDEDGILLTNKTAYANGIYGQVAIRGGGIFLSDSIDQTSGLRFWNTGITPHGINASLITTGQLDTNVIRIFAGSDMAFLWNAEGLNAFKREGNSFSTDNYIRYSGEGLHYILNNKTALALDWNGLIINGGEGTTSLDSKYGLAVYDGEKKLISEATEEAPEEYNWLIRIGRFIKINTIKNEDGTEIKKEEEYAGMRLYQRKEELSGSYTYIPTLDATNNGRLWLRNTLTVGGDSIDTATVGISGIEDYALWAGRGIEKDKDGNVIGTSSIDTSTFYVKHDGSLKATKATIEGSIIATSGKIGNWYLSSDYLAAGKINSENKPEYYAGLYFENEWRDYYYPEYEKESSPIRFFAGGTHGNRNFYVSEAGRLFATEARFGRGDSYIKLASDENASIESSNYWSGSSGWAIKSDGSGEFSNIKVRGEISSVVFKKEEVSAIGGKLYLSPSQFYDSITIIENTDNIQPEYYFVVPIDITMSVGIKINISASNIIYSGNTQSKTYEAICTQVTAPTEEQKKQNILPKATFKFTDKFKNEVSLAKTLTWTNVTLVTIGLNDKDEYILLDASGAEGTPFIDIKDSTQLNGPQVRLGNLAGVSNKLFGTENLTGYGLYAQNAYLTGKLILPNAGISNQSEISYNGFGGYIANGTDVGKQIRIWAGGDVPSANQTAAPFIVTQDGTLYASKGIFSGIIQTAGVIVESDENKNQASHNHFYIAKEYDNSSNSDLTLDNCILNFDKNGAQLFEGTFAVYSDKAQENTYYYYKKDILLSTLYKEDSQTELHPYFQFIDAFNSNSESRWLSQAGQIFNINDENKTYNSISFKDGIYFEKGKIEDIDYNATFNNIENSLKLQDNCLNISSNKVGINMSAADKIEGSIGIRGSINMKGQSESNRGVIVSMAQNKKGEICGLNFVSLQ